MKRRMMILVLAYVMVVPGTAFAASKADEQAEEWRQRYERGA